MRDCIKHASDDFHSLWKEICDEIEQKESDWVSKLRALGVSASHPDDGWVNRATNEVHFTYPQFNDGVSVNSLVVLGHPDKYRLVELKSKRETLLGLEWWKFKELYSHAKGVE